MSTPVEAEARAVAGDLVLHPALERLDAVASPVAAALPGWAGAAAAAVTEIDPDVADTAALVEAHGVSREASANCVVVSGKRAGEERIAACVVLATTRADVNGAVKRLLDVRKASFLAMERAVTDTGMEYGGITPVGLPDGWRVLVDAAVAATPYVVIGSGVRRSKLVVRGADLASLPGAEVVEGLGV
ncbi:prolyl-tRNA editing enzyme YbaK/EbsC (Cys-tRNA(Pro) deacylase) [Kineococcus xinjiangensis]|uniref:Prolyl-tRNA editing enzyme YbaK/EbsC (Cys-tRNA(Pro) deacylase) n=1 Tax=Kineococcus xinjiangensis TaxID=512762 RepID=A0A2S6ID74_9ACTN|nr:YbaK/EbsC family protein [Kineococcus xinjiangensis]PPK92146.1 prolyl-tRNA editing enzyme YbaK/EbsC (Cys-tRNA(Pro) deacylase) [Kineococcus xinjiangensis]